MSKPSIQMTCFVVFGLVTSSAVGSSFAQSPVMPSNASQGNLQVEKAVRETPVRPIHRTKKPAKPAVADWTTMASTYSHDSSGQRVDQYAQSVEPMSMERPDFVRSGYRHTRSTLQAGFSADHYHQTETWGQPVRPYGEWRYPNRPFSVPYSQWGPQLPQVLVGGNQWNTNLRWGAAGNGMNPGGVNPGLPANGMVPGNFQGNHGPVHNIPMQNGQFPNTPAGGMNGFGGPAWWGQGQMGMGPGFGQGLGVGPRNALPAGQDEYYPQAPTYHSLPDEGFHSPFRN